MHRAVLGVLLAGLGFATNGQPWDLQALMQEMAQVPSSRARFVETRHIALLTRPVELKGSLSYERPHRLAKHVESPIDEILSVDGDALTVLNKTKGEQRVLSLREQPAAGALVASVRATLAGDRAQLERHYKVDLSGARGSWSLRLVPRDARIKGYVEAITLAGAGARLDRIETVETSGDRSLMTILHDGK
ncbi:MAG TPA: LolA-related protein [Burkholderiales bacterium]|nr:LolA-related protein [Burkholderiales bacterium]